MQTVAVLSLKGGVGKTTVTLGLASAAMRRGVRTLVVDLDPQCNATACLEPGETEADLRDVLADPGAETLRAAISPTSWDDDVDVLVGSEDGAQYDDGAHLGRLTTALSALDEAADPGGGPPYQLVLLDCPPSLERMTRSALVAGDRALLVTEPTIFAVSGVQRAFEAVQAEREERNPALQPLGVVVNRIRARSQEHQFRVEELREIFGPLVMPVSLPDRLAVQQTQGACMPIHRWDTPGAREIALAFNLLLARTLRAGGRTDPAAQEHPDSQEDPDAQEAPDEQETPGAQETPDEQETPGAQENPAAQVAEDHEELDEENLEA